MTTELREAQSSIRTFNTANHIVGIDLDIRVVDQDGEPWFVAKDVLEALGMAKGSAHHYLRYLGDDEKTTVEKRATQNRSLAGLFQGRSARVALISESGLYKLIMRSDKPQVLQSFTDALHLAADTQEKPEMSS